MIKNRISLFLATFLIIGFFFLALPEKGYSGIDSVLGGPSCCDGLSRNICFGGEDAFEACQTGPCSNPDECEFFPDGICVPDGDSPRLGSCVLSSPIPTISEWGLIAMAGILGIVGFMVIRRRKAAS